MCEPNRVYKKTDPAAERLRKAKCVLLLPQNISLDGVVECRSDGTCTIDIAEEKVLYTLTGSRFYISIDVHDV